jgi:hypothetical protein
MCRTGAWSRRTVLSCCCKPTAALTADPTEIDLHHQTIASSIRGMPNQVFGWFMWLKLLMQECHPQG